MDKLPRGIWYEADRDRYRVRLYRNTVPYLVGYYKTRDEACEALSGLRGRLQKTPKRRHSHAQAVPCSTFRGLTESMRQDVETDPRPYRKH